MYVAGCMLSDDDWERVEPAWQERLDRDDVSRFRASKCEAARGEFEKWSRPRIDSLFWDLSGLLSGLDCAVTWVQLHKENFKEVSLEFPSIEVRDYEFCLLRAAEIAGLLPIILKRPDTVKLIFESGQPCRQHVRNRIKLLHNGVPNEVLPIEFQRKENHVRFQVADLIAWEYLRYTKGKVVSPHRPLRPSLRRLIDVDPDRLVSYPFWAKEKIRPEFVRLRMAYPEGFRPPS